jgi:hypothetical protein
MKHFVTLFAVLAAVFLSSCSASQRKPDAKVPIQNRLAAVVTEKSSQMDALSLFGVPSKKIQDGKGERWEYNVADGYTKLTLYFDSGPTISRVLWMPNPEDGFLTLDAAVSLFPEATFREVVDPVPPPHTTTRMIRLFDDQRGIQILATNYSRSVEAIALYGSKPASELRAPSAPKEK